MAFAGFCSVSGRVLDPNSAPSDINTILELLEQADPAENDIFGEAEVPRRAVPPKRQNPAFHLLDTLSRPTYIDASDFRDQEALSPALDINRQLTILSASKFVQPPVDIVHASEGPTVDEGIERLSFDDASPLFRDDFPSDDTDYIIEPLESEREIIADQDSETANEEPRISTSVSVSTSVTYSNGTSVANDSSVPSTTESTTLASSPSSTTADPSIEDHREPRAESLIAVEEEPSYIVAGEYRPTYVSSDDFRAPGLSSYPVESALSPLGHILSGFGAEFGPFGGDVRRDGFIRGFRPDGF